MASDLIGFMAGMKMAGNVFKKMDSALSPSSENAPRAADGASAAPETWTCSCGESSNLKNSA